MADCETKYSAVANKFWLNELNEYQKDVLNLLLKKEMCLCVSELVVERVCAIRDSVRPWERKTALFLSLLSIMEQEVTHLNSHGIPAVMLGKCRVDDRKDKKGAFVYMYASSELLSDDQCWNLSVRRSNYLQWTKLTLQYCSKLPI